MKIIAFAFSGLGPSGCRHWVSPLQRSTGYGAWTRLRLGKRPGSARAAGYLCASRESERNDDRSFELKVSHGGSNGASRMGETTNAARQATTTGSATESAAEDEALFPWVANHVEQVVDPSPIDSMDERWDARIVREVAFMRRQKLRESSGMPAWLRFFLDIYDEWQMIDWPSPQRTFRILVVSIIFLVLAMAYIYSLDSVFGWLSSILFEK